MWRNALRLLRPARAISSGLLEIIVPEQSAEVKLLAYALYRLKILLGAHLGSQSTSPTELRVAAHLSYALHEEALAILEDRNFDLEAALAKLPRGSGFIYRHYHLDDAERVARFQKLAYLARKHCHLVILADSAITARAWGADGIYGAPRALYPRRIDMLQLATAHDLAEIGLANRFGAECGRYNHARLLPVFPEKRRCRHGRYDRRRFLSSPRRHDRTRSGIKRSHRWG